MPLKLRTILAGLVLIPIFHVTTVFAQSTAFTYQGRLSDGSNAANGHYDMQFALYDSPVGGVALGLPVTLAGTPVSNGVFMVALDFGSVFTGADRWLEIGVRVPGGGTTGSPPFTTLVPRQLIRPVPQALYAENSRSATIVPAGNITGILSPAQLPAGLITNGASGVSLSGTFGGDGSGLTNLNVPPGGGGASSNAWLLGGQHGESRAAPGQPE